MIRKKMATTKVIAVTKKNMIKADGSFPVYLQVTYDRAKKLIALGFSVEKKEFDFTTQKYKKNKEGNLKINAIEQKAFEVATELGENYSENAFKEKFFGANVKGFTVAEYIENLVKAYREKGKNGTADCYDTAKNVLAGYKGKKVKFTDLTPKFLEQFETHLKKTNGVTSIGMYMRHIRAAFNSAIDEGIVSRDLYPFSNNTGKGYGKKGYQIKTKKTKSKFSLPKEDILRIISYPTKPKTRLRDSINYFAFSYLCRGMNFKDMCNLKWDDIKNERIIYIRSKTEDTNAEEKEISIKITERIASILAQYSGNDPYIFPILEPNLPEKTAKFRMHGRLKKINKDIRTIAEDLNIPRFNEIVFYVARHTYASILSSSNVNIADISESLGHSSIKTTENYLHSLNERLDKNDELLT